MQEKRPKPRQDRRQKSNVHVVTPVTPPTSYKWECVLCRPEKHPLFVCPKWQGYSVTQRLAHIQEKNLCQNCLAVGHSAGNCRSSYKCRECGLPHHTTIHQSPSTASTPVHAASVVSHQVPDALMMTAKVLITGPGGQTTQARALIDPGAGISLVSSKIARSLNLPLTPTNMQFSGVQGTPCKSSSHLANMTLSPLQDRTTQVKVKAAVVKTVTNDLPAQEIAPVDQLPHLSGLGHADPSFHTPGRIDILLGADVYPRLMLKQPMATGSIHDPAAQQAIFGWAIVGPVRYLGNTLEQIPTYFVQCQPSEDDQLTEQLAMFWKTEEPEASTSSLSSVEEQVQAHYSATTTYSVSPCRYYLPMHSVIKQSSTSTRLRVVFDGSAATTSGPSLNQSLHVGPSLHPTLATILMKFRTYPVAVTADIAKMYREVALAPQDKDLHRFIWRATPEQPVQDYRMTRVTFGVSASPYLAVRTLQQTAADHGAEHPIASSHILKSFYVDDLLAGANTVEEAVELFHSLRAVLKQGGFNLCKWRSSSLSVLQSIPEDLQEKLPVQEVTNHSHSSHPKALGLEWNSHLDVMSPSIYLADTPNITKCGIVSDVSKTFDVLGWISPSVLSMKMLYQKLWHLGIDWDETVPPDLTAQHTQWKEQLPLLTQKQLPRCYFRLDAPCVTTASQTPLRRPLEQWSTSSPHMNITHQLWP